MKKSLLAICVGIHTLMYSISLLYIGFEVGEAYLWHYPRGAIWLVLVLPYAATLWGAMAIRRSVEYVKSKTYFLMAAGILPWSFLWWGYEILEYSRNYLTMNDIDIIWYPFVMSALSVISAICYIICGVMRRKETKGQLGWE